MRDFPEGVRSVVLDSVYPPQVDLFLEGPANADRAFNALFDACAQDPECRVDYPNLSGVFYGLVDRLRTAPETITLRDPLSGETFPYTVDDSGMEGILFNFLYATEVLPYLPRMIFDANQGRWSSIGNILGSMFAQSSRAVSRGMQISVFCNEESVFGSAALFEAALGQHPHLEPLYRGSFLGSFGYQVCEGWESGEAGPAENLAVTSAVPTLIMAGAFDPITPPHWAELTRQTLSASTMTLYPATGHGASSTVCGQNMLVAFVENPSQAPASDCLANMWMWFAGPNDAMPFFEGVVQAKGLPPPIR
jgi:pimeloyl-ACP methyl ester carboxylesterase